MLGGCCPGGGTLGLLKHFFSLAHYNVNIIAHRQNSCALLYYHSLYTMSLTSEKFNEWMQYLSKVTYGTKPLL